MASILNLTSLLSVSQASLLVAPSLSVVPQNNVAFKWTTLDCIFASSQPPASAIRVWFQYLTYLLLLLIDKSFFMTNCCSAVPKNLTTVSAIQNTNFKDLDTRIVFALFLACTFWVLTIHIRLCNCKHIHCLLHVRVVLLSVTEPHYIHWKQY